MAAKFKENFSTVNVFIDTQNTNITAMQLCDNFEPKPSEAKWLSKSLRVNYYGIDRLAIGRRESGFKYAGILASSKGDIKRSTIVPVLENLNYNLEISEYDFENRKMLVSEYMQKAMLDYAESRWYDNKLETFVLVSGKGKPTGKNGPGFLYVLEALKDYGHRIELLTWFDGCNGTLREFALRHGKFTPLEQYYYAVTYLIGPFARRFKQFSDEGVGLPENLPLAKRTRYGILYDDPDNFKKR